MERRGCAEPRAGGLRSSEPSRAPSRLPIAAGVRLPCSFASRRCSASTASVSSSRISCGRRSSNVQRWRSPLRLATMRPAEHLGIQLAGRATVVGLRAVEEEHQPVRLLAVLLHSGTARSPPACASPSPGRTRASRSSCSTASSGTVQAACPGRAVPRKPPKGCRAHERHDSPAYRDKEKPRITRAFP